MFKMYKVKLKNLEHIEGFHYLKDFKNGDIRTVSDIQFKTNREYFIPLEHYRMVTSSMHKCKTCGQPVIKRKKVILK